MKKCIHHYLHILLLYRSTFHSHFYFPLILCVGSAEEQHRLPGSQAVLNTVVVRLGGLMVLMLTVGRWADVLHIIMCFLGEAGCLIPTMDLLDATSSQVSESPWKQRTGLKALFVHRDPENWGRIAMCSLDWVPRWGWTSLTCIPGGEGKISKTEWGQSVLKLWILSLLFLSLS